MSKRDIDVPAIGEVGHIFNKYFPGHGWFEGKVIAIRPGAKGGKDRRCQYEDGDVEDVTLAHLKGLPKRKKRSQNEATKQKSSSSSSSSKSAKKNKKNLPEATNTSTAAAVTVSSDADTRAATKASTNSKMRRPSKDSPILPRPSSREKDASKVTAESLAVEAAAEAVAELVADESLVDGDSGRSPNVDSVILGQKGMDAPSIVTTSTYGSEAGVDLQVHGNAAARAAFASSLLVATATIPLKAPPASSSAGKKEKVKCCKAPGAPKRFKSAFIFFTMHRHKTIRREIEEQFGKGDGDRTPDVAKIISEEWRNMKPEERSVWDEKARLDKERFEVEKALYKGPWKIPVKQKARKDPGAPKRPMSSFLSYSHSKRSEIKRTHPGISNSDASKLLAKMWKEAPYEEKREHIEREERLREIYKREIAEYRNKKKNEMEEIRGKREEAALNYIDKRSKGIIDETTLTSVSWGDESQVSTNMIPGTAPGAPVVHGALAPVAQYPFQSGNVYEAAPAASAAPAMHVVPAAAQAQNPSGHYIHSGYMYYGHSPYMYQQHPPSTALGPNSAVPPPYQYQQYLPPNTITNLHSGAPPPTVSYNPYPNGPTFHSSPIGGKQVGPPSGVHQFNSITQYNGSSHMFPPPPPHVAAQIAPVPTVTQHLQSPEGQEKETKAVGV